MLLVIQLPDGTRRDWRKDGTNPPERGITTTGIATLNLLFVAKF